MLMRIEMLEQAIATACDQSRLVVQITPHRNDLSIVVNYPPDCPPNVEHLTQTVHTTLTSELEAALSGSWLHGRVLGMIEPDFSQYIQLQTESLLPRSGASAHRRASRTQPTARPRQSASIHCQCCARHVILSHVVAISSCQ